MKKIILLALTTLLATQSLLATDYYVDAVNGSNSNNGRTPATAFQTLSKVSYTSTTLAPGDVVYIRNGTYGTTDLANVQSSFAVLAITQSGVDGNPITFKNYPGESPLIQFNNWNAVYIQAAYIVIEGLRIRGNASVINLTDATNQPSGCNDPSGSPLAKFNGNGIIFDPNGVTLCHHITVRNCEIYECCGGGLAGTKNDYITLEGNVVWGNAKYSRYGNSGISLLHLTDYDANTSTYRNIIRNNIVYDNEMLVPWYSGSCRGFTDGNGIIIDDANNGQSGGSGVRYNGKTLIENNVVYNNGGRGVHVFVSDNVTVLNNTVYQNNKTPAISDGEITVMSTAASQSSGNRVFNNVMMARPGKRLSSVNNQTSFTENSNLMYGSGLFAYFNSRDIMAAPEFTDTLTYDLRLRNTSPGIDAGNDTAGNYSTRDILGVNRPFQTLPDMGAYEYNGALPVRSTFTGGNLALLRIGDGTTLNTGNAVTGVPMGNLAQVLEYSKSGTATGFAIALPATGTNKIIADGLTNSYGGQLTASSDGRYLSLIAYKGDVPNDYTALRATDKMIARLDWTGTLDTSTRIPNIGTGAAIVNQGVRNVVTDNGSSYLIAAANVVFRTVNHFATTASTVPTGSFTARSINRFGGLSFSVDQGDNSLKMHNANVATALPGIPASVNARQTVLAFDLDPAVGWNGTAYDVVYVSAVNGTATGLQKYFFDNTNNTWLDGGTFNSTLGGATNIGFYSITGNVVSGLVEIYAIKGVAENNALIKLIDNSGRTGNWFTATGGSATTATLLANAGTKYMFRGVAFTPTRYGNNPPQTIIVLPVRLSSVKGYLVNNDALIQWSTSMEANTKEFEIERSSDGVQFSGIGKVAATNRSTGAVYSYTDKNLAEGLFYYRLRTVDRDGKFSISKTVIIRNKKLGMGEVTLFPNPAVQNILISYPAVQKASFVLVVDMAGREMHRQVLMTGSRQTTLDVSALAKGVYSVMITTDDGLMVTKFMK